MAGCGQCGAHLDLPSAQIGRRDVCPSCGADLHACIQCRHHDETVAKACKEPFAEVPEDKASGNFCDFFQIGDGAVREGGARREDLLSAAEALFSKKR